MTSPITVLMPNYNNGPFLKEAIDSILKQTFPDFILLIVDDGSTDNSLDIIKSYTDKRIILIEKKTNSGIVDSLNIGLAQLNTPYMIRMDGDDISAPNRLAILYEFMEANPDIGVCGSSIKTFGQSNEVWKYKQDKAFCKARLIFNNGVGHASSIFRMEPLKKNNITYSNKHPYLEDYTIFSELKAFTNFSNVPEELYYYRILTHNSTVKNAHTRYDRYRNFYKDVLTELDIAASERNTELHLEFFIKPTLSFSIKEYKKFINQLILQNDKQSIYPQQELKQVLEEQWENFFFKIVPLSLYQSFIYFCISKKNTIQPVELFDKM